MKLALSMLHVSGVDLDFKHYIMTFSGTLHEYLNIALILLISIIWYTPFPSRLITINNEAPDGGLNMANYRCTHKYMLRPCKGYIIHVLIFEQTSITRHKSTRYYVICLGKLATFHLALGYNVNNMATPRLHVT